MKPRLKFARVRIEWEAGRIPCTECPFEALSGTEPVCSACMDNFHEINPNVNDFHPIIVSDEIV